MIAVMFDATHVVRSAWHVYAQETARVVVAVSVRVHVAVSSAVTAALTSSGAIKNMPRSRICN